MSFDQSSFPEEDWVIPAPSAEPDGEACLCDGGSYFTEQQNRERYPFLLHPDCPIHAKKCAWCDKPAVRIGARSRYPGCDDHCPAPAQDGEAVVSCSCASGRGIRDCPTHAPAQDGAEVEALDVLLNEMDKQARLMSWRPWPALIYRLRVVLAQRDKDRDVAVAAKGGTDLNRKFYEEGRAHAAEQIAQAVEAVLPTGPRPYVDLHSIGAWDLATKVRAAIARAAAPAGDER